MATVQFNQEQHLRDNNLQYLYCFDKTLVLTLFDCSIDQSKYKLCTVQAFRKVDREAKSGQCPPAEQWTARRDQTLQTAFAPCWDRQSGQTQWVSISLGMPRCLSVLRQYAVMRTKSVYWRSYRAGTWTHPQRVWAYFLPLFLSWAFPLFLRSLTYFHSLLLVFRLSYFSLSSFGRILAVTKLLPIRCSFFSALWISSFITLSIAVPSLWANHSLSFNCRLPQAFPH